MMQHELPFNMTLGTSLHWCNYLYRYFEECLGGYVFSIGEKRDCFECASDGGCIEMAVNFGFMNLLDVYHLIQRPEILAEKYRIALDVAGIKINQ